MGLPLRRPAAAVGSQHDDVGVGVEVDQRRPPAVFLVLVLYRVNDDKAAVDAPLLAVPERGGGGRGVEADAAADVRICGQGGEHAAVFQLISAGFGVGGNQTVVGHQLLQPAQRAAVAHKAIEHTAGCQRVHRFLSPVAADLQLAQPLGQRNAKVHVLQGDVSLIILVLGGVAALVVVVGLGQLGQLPLFLPGQARHSAKRKGGGHGAPFTRCASCGSGRVYRSLRPTAPAHRLLPAGCCLRQSRTRRRWGA